MRKYIKEHLTIKVFLVTIMLLLTLSAAIYGMITFGMSNFYLTELNKSLEKELDTTIEQISNMTNEETQKTLERFAIEYGISIIVKNQEGDEIGNYGEISYFLAPDANSSKAQNSKGITKNYIVKSNEGTVYKLQIFGTKESVNIGLKVLNRILPSLGVITVIVSILIALFFARYITRPILKVNEASKRMVKLDFRKPYPEKRSDEIGILGENLNQLAEHLEDTLQELKEKNQILQDEIQREQEMERKQLSFFAAVSHELKTPVTILKGQIQGMISGIGGYKDRDKYLKRSYEVVFSMEGLIQEILDVSRMKSAGFLLNFSTISLDSIVKGIIQEWEDIATDRGVTLHTEIEEKTEICADRVLFQKVIGNLISNAVKYTPDNGNIWCKVYKNEEGVIFSVENNAEHISEQEIPKLFDAFYRREKSRNRKAGGSGLGLYIVKMIVELHHYECDFKNTNQGIEVKIVCKE